MMFTRAAATTFLSSLGVDTSQMDDAVLQMVYTQKVEEVNQSAKEIRNPDPTIAGSFTGTACSSSVDADERRTGGSNYAT